jgi:prepilin-type N-terminal cleavage/methylation domain-containing protein
MKFEQKNGSSSRGHAGMTLVEVMVAVGVLGIMITSLYAGFTYAFTQVRRGQENVRATQIIEERMEMVRLLNWDQIVNQPGYVPSTFKAPFFSDNPTNTPTSGSFDYTGTVVVAAAPVTESYSNNLRMVTIQVSWVSRGVACNRQMTTLVSQYGIQKYAY